MKKRDFFVPLLVFLLLSCHQHSQYEIPHVTTPKQFHSMTSTYKENDNLPYCAWWQQFNNAQLNHLIDSGLKNNLDVHIAISNLERAKGQLLQVKLGWLPIVSVLAGYSTNPALGIPGAFYGIWPEYAINIATQLKQQDLAKFNVEYHRAMIDSMRLTVIGQVASSYFTLIAEKEQWRLLKVLDDDLKKLVQFVQQDIKIGLKNNIDLAPFLVQEKDVMAQMNTVEHNLVLSQNALRYLVNENPGTVKSNNNFSRIDFTKFKPGSLPTSVIQNRPDVRMAAYAVQRARAGLAIAYSEFFPILQLDEYFGQSNRSSSTFSEVTDSYVNWELTPSTLGEISAQKGAYKAQIHEYVKTVRNSFKDVDNDFSANQHATKYFMDTRAAERVYKNKYELQKGLLNAGLISYKELLESKIMFDHLALLTNQAKLQLAMTLVLLYQDLAGGYKAEV